MFMRLTYYLISVIWSPRASAHRIYSGKYVLGPVASVLLMVPVESQHTYCVQAETRVVLFMFVVLARRERSRIFLKVRQQMSEME